jgi:hypothetical protein
MPWAVLSAEHGMVDPETILEPYDRYLGKEPAAFRRQWSAKVAQQVLARLKELGFSAVEIHAGAAYVDNGLGTRLRAVGIEVMLPLKGLAFGRQLGFYS